MWAVRKRFWNTIAVTKYKANKPVSIPLPQDDGRKLEAVGLIRQFPKVPVPNIRVADHVPADTWEFDGESWQCKLGCEQ